MEHTYIGLIEAGIRGLKQGTKTPSTTKAPMALNRLKPINEAMYEDLLGKWGDAVRSYNEKQRD